MKKLNIMLLAVGLTFSGTSLMAQADKREERKLERAEKKKGQRAAVRN